MRQPVPQKILIFLNVKLFCLPVEEEQQINVHTLLCCGRQMMIMVHGLRVRPRTIQADLYLCLLKYMTWCILSVDIITSEWQASRFVRLTPKGKFVVDIGRWSVFTREQVQKQWIREKSVYDMSDTVSITWQRKKLACLKYTSAAFAISSSAHQTVAKFSLRIP